MKQFKHYLLAAVIALPLASGAQNTGATGTAPSQGATTPNTTQAGGPLAQSSAIKILSPKAGEKLTSSALSVTYELLNDGISAAGSPNYRLQLDSRDPVETTSTDYSFSGLAPGKHVLTVDVVDANHTPIMGSQTQVQFTTANPGAENAAQQPAANQQPAQPAQGQQQPAQQQQQAQPQQQSPRAELMPPSVTKASLPLPDSGKGGELPSAAGELPMLSMVGFGVLIGGVISAMRTRR